MRNLKLLLFFSLIIFLVSSCTKELSTTQKSGMAHFSVRLTDAPANYDAVNVDIQGVEILYEEGKAVVLNTQKGVYNLFDFQNGINAVIASDDINAGTISQIRLILGDGNTVTVGGVDHSLKTPSAQQSGLKLQLHQTLLPDVSYSILLDFDAKKSIVEEGNGNFLLKPVIKNVSTVVNGEIKGSITPVGTVATAAAVFNGVTYTSPVGTDGNFLIHGLPPGTYDVTITPAAPLQPKTITGIIVTEGTTTDMGTIALAGDIKGSITPVGTVATAAVTFNGFTYSSPVGTDGKFQIKGLPAGTYSVTITPAAPYQAKTVTGIIVTVGAVTDMGTIALGGAVKGSISPVGTAATAAVISNGVTYSAPVGTDGKFQIDGLPAGTYDVTITPTAPALYQVKTVIGVVVTVGATTDMGIVALVLKP